MVPVDKIDQTFNFSAFGAPGLVIGALFTFIYFLIREHKSERKDWIEAYREQSQMMDDRQKETNNVIRELVTVVREANVRQQVR